MLMNVGQTYLKMDNHQQAVGFLDRAYRINPGAPGLRLMLARAIGDLGDFDHARQLYERCLEDPDERAGALGGLARLGKQTATDNLLPQIEAGLREATQPGPLGTLHYAAAKTYLDLQDGDAAFDHLQAAKAQSEFSIQPRSLRQCDRTVEIHRRSRP